MITKLKYLLLLIFLLDLVLLGVLVHFTSWPFTIAFVLISGLLGSWVLKEGLRNFFKRSQISIANQAVSAEDVMLGALARLAAGVLLIVPGVLTDIAALCLLSPAGKWLTKVFIVSLFMILFPKLAQNNFQYQYYDQKPPEDQIIDVKVIEPITDRLEHDA